MQGMSQGSGLNGDMLWFRFRQGGGAFVFGSVAFISVIVSGVSYVMCLGFSQSAECFVYSIAAGTKNGKIVPKIILKMTAGNRGVWHTVAY